MHNLSIYDSLSKEGKQDTFEQMTPIVINYTIKLMEKVSELNKRFEPTLLNLISKTRLKKELEVTDKTLEKWEANGLKRYQPPLEDTRKFYYRVSDVLIFLGADK